MDEIALEKPANFEFRADQLEYKTMLRAYDNGNKGATAFFRNRPLMDTVMSFISSGTNKAPRFLFHSSSVGAEPYSYAIYCHIHQLTQAYDISFFSTDLNANFIQFARAGVYPKDILQHMTDLEKSYFKPVGSNEVTPIDEIKEMIHFLPPQSFTNTVDLGMFDFVFVLNALTYVSADEQSKALDTIATYNTGYIFLTAFHPDSIKDDLIRNGYRPISTNMEAIHNNWHDRLTKNAVPKDSSQYSILLLPFGTVEDFEYKHCAIFKKIESSC